MKERQPSVAKLRRSLGSSGSLGSDSGAISNHDSLALVPETDVDRESAPTFLGSAVTLPESQLIIDKIRGIRAGSDHIARGPHRIELGKVLGRGAFGVTFDGKLHRSVEEQSLLDAASEGVVDAASDKKKVGKNSLAVKFIPLWRTKGLQQAHLDEVASLAKTRMLYDAWIAQNEGNSAQVLVLEMKKLKGPNKQTNLDELRRLPLHDRISHKRVLQSLVSLRSELTQLLVMARRGLQHRDLKPANIMLNDHDARLTDFGLTDHIDNIKDKYDRERAAKISTTVRGTPMFMTANSARGIPDLLVDVLPALLVAELELDSARPNLDAKTPSDILKLQGTNKYWTIANPEAEPERFNGEQMMDLARITKLALDNEGVHYNPYGPGTPFHREVQAARKREAAVKDQELLDIGKIRYSRRTGLPLPTNLEMVEQDDLPDAHPDTFTQLNLVTTTRNLLYRVNKLALRQRRTVHEQNKAEMKETVRSPRATDLSGGLNEPHKKISPFDTIIESPQADVVMGNSQDAHLPPLNDLQRASSLESASSVDSIPSIAPPTLHQGEDERIRLRDAGGDRKTNEGGVDSPPSILVESLDTHAGTLPWLGAPPHNLPVDPNWTHSPRV